MHGLCMSTSLCGRLLSERGTCLSLLWCHCFVAVLFFLLLLFSLLALCSCGLRELFVCVVSFSGFGIRLCPLLCLNRWCDYHTLEPVVF
jgi:hypothetical protein